MEKANLESVKIQRKLTKIATMTSVSHLSWGNLYKRKPIQEFGSGTNINETKVAISTLAV